MSETKHTPLPWNAPPSHPFLVRSANMELVLDCRREGKDCYTAGDVANAELIVRAVNSHHDLLEACRAALPYLRNHVAMTLDEGPGDRNALDMCEEAIEKATAKH